MELIDIFSLNVLVTFGGVQSRPEQRLPIIPMEVKPDINIIGVTTTFPVTDWIMNYMRVK